MLDKILDLSNEAWLAPAKIPVRRIKDDCLKTRIIGKRELLLTLLVAI